MAKETQTYFANRIRGLQTQRNELPRELQELRARLRKARGYTRHQMASRMGLAHGDIGDIERETANITRLN